VIGPPIHRTDSGECFVTVQVRVPRAAKAAMHACAWLNHNMGLQVPEAAWVWFLLHTMRYRWSENCPWERVKNLAAKEPGDPSYQQKGGRQRMTRRTRTLWILLLSTIAVDAALLAPNTHRAWAASAASAATIAALAMACAPRALQYIRKRHQRHYTTIGRRHGSPRPGADPDTDT